MSHFNQKEYRCPDDNKLLFKGLLIDSTIEVKCRGCKNIIEVEGEPAEDYLCKKEDCANRQS